MDAQPIAPLCFHRQVIMAQHYPLYTKRIVIGYTTAFNATLCIIFDKKQQFFGLDADSYGNFIKHSTSIDTSFGRGEKKIFDIGKIHRLRLCEKNGARFAVLEDVSRHQRIMFSAEELGLFLKYIKIFSHAIQRLIDDKPKAIQFYRCYVESCVRFSVATVDDFRMILCEEDETNFHPLDIHLLFHQIPVMMPYELQREICRQVTYSDA